MTENKNIVELALSMGFESKPTNIRPNDNWMGVSVYHPDMRLTMGNKIIVLSLNGISSPIPDNPSVAWLNNPESRKYIAFYIDNEIKYETHSGLLPSSEFIKSFFE